MGDRGQGILKRKIARADKLQFKVIGRTPHGDAVARLTIDGRDVKDIMIRKRAGKAVAPLANGHINRPHWGDDED